MSSTAPPAMLPPPQQSGPRHPPRTVDQEREIHDYIRGHKAAITTCPMCDWRRKEIVRLWQLLPARMPSQAEQIEYQAAVAQHLAGYDQKGEPMAQVDSDTLKDTHKADIEALKTSHAALEKLVETLSKQQAENHAAVLNALTALSQTTEKPATPVAEKE